MTRPEIEKQLNLTVACGPVPCDTEQGRAFLQERLKLFGKITFILCFGHLLARELLLLWQGADWQASLTNVYNQLQAGMCVVFGITYLICRARRSLSHMQLATIDGLSIFSIGILLGFRCNCTAMDEGIDLDATVILALSNTLLARAVIVPSSAAQTFISSLLASIPLIVGAYSATGSGSSAMIQSVWLFLPIAIGTIASHIIYGLRQEVLEAKQFGQYTLEEKIGAGGMGEVYRARHSLLRRPTAIKLLRPGIAGEKNLARFEREVQLTSLLTHPNTVAIYDYGHTPDGVFYYAMEYLEGANLEQLVRASGPQPHARVLHIMKQICSSLIEAHESGMIHRDIKPANIILCERGGMKDVVKVVDFGLAKDIDSTTDVTVSSENSITGTPMYLSPESIRTPTKVDARSDLYALGAVAYYLICGQHIFEKASFVEVCSHHLHTIPIVPSARTGVRVPADLEGLVMMCLEKKPNMRPKNTRALLLAFEICADSDDWTQESARAWWRKHPMDPDDAAGAKSDASSSPTSSQVIEGVTLTQRNPAQNLGP